MNKQISRIALVALLLLASLIVATTYWQVWAAPGPRGAPGQRDPARRAVQDQARPHLRVGRQDRAREEPHQEVGRSDAVLPHAIRRTGSPSQAVGYSTQGRSRAGIERQENAYLTAANANLGTIWDKLTDKLKGTTVRGNNLVLNMHVGAQKIAETALRGKCGAAVVLNPKTGAVYVMASSPSYDPNRIESPNGFAEIHPLAQRLPGSSSALLNRATQGVYPPGSTFKTVTAAAALDSGKYTADSKFYDPGYCIEYGKQRLERRRPRGTRAVRQRQLPPGLPALDQRRLLRHRQEARRAGSARQGEGLRLLLEAAGRAAEERGRPQRALRLLEGRALRRRRQGRPGPARVRSGQAARDAAADGARRGCRRQQGHDHAATPHQEGDRARRRHGRQGEAARLAPRDEARDRGGAERDDAGGGRRAARAPPHRSPGSRSQARRAPQRPGRTASIRPGSSSSRPPTIRRLQAPWWWSTS